MGKTDSAVIVRELTVGQLAARSGVAITALRFYEARGLISSQRNSGNQRRYSRDVLRRVALIKTAQKLGIALASIQAAFETLPQDRPPDTGRLGQPVAALESRPGRAHQQADRPA